MSTTMSAAMAEQYGGKHLGRRVRKQRGLIVGSNRRAGTVTYIWLAVVVALSILPLYYAVLLASSNASDIAQNPIPSLFPQGQLWENLQRVAGSDIGLMQALFNSLIVAVITSLSVVAFSTLAGFSFAKLRYRGRGPLFVTVLVTMAIPTNLSVVPMFIVMSELGWVGQLQAVIVPGLVTAFGVFWITQYLSQALPYELVEAARVDGASMFRTFRSVALPAARPAAAMLGLFTFVASWTNFFWPSIVLGSSNPTLPVALQLLQSTYFKDMSLIMAGVLISAIPLLLLFVVAGRQFVAGIMQGAIKG